MLLLLPGDFICHDAIFTGQDSRPLLHCCTTQLWLATITALCVGRPIKVPCQMCRPFYCPREAEAAAVKQKGTEKSRDGEGEGGVCRK